MHADVTAHRHNHGFTGLSLAAFLKVRHQIGGHLLKAGFCADNAFQCRPFTLQLGLLVLFLISGRMGFADPSATFCATECNSPCNSFGLGLQPPDPQRNDSVHPFD